MASQCPEFHVGRRNSAAGRRNSALERRNSSAALPKCSGAEKWSALVRRSIIERQSRAWPEVSAHGGSTFTLGRVVLGPTLKKLGELKKALKKADKTWMRNFLSDNGVDTLLDTLGSLCERKRLQLSDTILQLECVGCIRAVMNSQSGLDYIIENKEFTRKLATGKSY
jgi:hypothetical protein